MQLYLKFWFNLILLIKRTIARMHIIQVERGWQDRVFGYPKACSIIGARNVSGVCVCNKKTPDFASELDGEGKCQNIIGNGRRHIIKKLHNRNHIGFRLTIHEGRQCSQIRNISFWSIANSVSEVVVGQWNDATQILMHQTKVVKGYFSLRLNRTWRGKVLKIVFECNLEVILKIKGKSSYLIDTKALDTSSFDMIYRNNTDKSDLIDKELFLSLNSTSVKNFLSGRDLIGNHLQKKGFHPRQAPSIIIIFIMVLLSLLFCSLIVVFSVKAVIMLIWKE